MLNANPVNACEFLQNPVTSEASKSRVPLTAEWRVRLVLNLVPDALAKTKHGVDNQQRAHHSEIREFPEHRRASRRLLTLKRAIRTLACLFSFLLFLELLPNDKTYPTRAARRVSVRVEHLVRHVFG